MPAIDLDAAIGTYWSEVRVGVTGADVAAAWSAAAQAVWKDEVHVDQRDGATRASFLANSGQARMTVCECALLVAPAQFLTVVLEQVLGLNLGWAIHTRTLDATWGEDWPNPSFGERALRDWSGGA
ncbi:MAG TPA: hypothetical protein VNS09_25675 [Solirubrobacter sp.]|nr:hypothetical protein [Solirubrobacter sp.]